VVVLAIAATAAVLILKDRDGVPTAEVLLRDEEFTATSPWRLVIRNDGSAGDGCAVTVTVVDSGHQVAAPTDIYQSKSFQLRQTGTFRWKANAPGCLVFLNPGTGKTVLPFVHDDGGDTDAFDTQGQVAVEVTDFHGNPECTFALHDAADGRQLDVGSVRQGAGPLLLDPGQQSPVYLTNLYCGAHISAG
jgi:hypothetical protein